MEITQLEYYRRREAQARKLADSAKDDCARRVHLAMAARYSAIAHGDDSRKMG